MDCVVCFGSEPPVVPLGCACADAGAHVECMARRAHVRSRAGAGAGAWRTCDTCGQKLSGPMLHRLCAAPEDGDAVCAIQELARAVHAAGHPVPRPPVNDQTHFDVLIADAGARARVSTRRGGLHVLMVRIDGSLDFADAASFCAGEVDAVLAHIGRAVEKSNTRA